MGHLQVPMKTTQTPYVPRKSGLMDFEPVTVEAARESIEELPEGMAALLSNQYWEKVRRAPLATDRLLTGRAMEWITQLPPPLRPNATTDRYARIVNALAAAWTDPLAREQSFEHLLDGRRRGRRGFPPDVERELRILSRYAATLPR
jgi:hypothetical protein